MKKFKFLEKIIFFLLFVGTFIIGYSLQVQGLGLQTNNNIIENGMNFGSFKISGITTYNPKFSPLSIEESMTITPIFTPDNALDVYSAWFSRANNSIDVQNQYLKMFDSCSGTTVAEKVACWGSDSSPLVRGLVDAHNRGVTVRVQINEDSDSDHVTKYFQSIGIQVRWMGSSISNPDGDYLSTTHNKIVIIDGKVTILSSINFSENAFTNNREAGVVVQSATVANYYLSVFNNDWNDGETPPNYPLVSSQTGTAFSSAVFLSSLPPKNRFQSNFPSHTNLIAQNFTGTFNVTLFVNPDNAEDVIFDFLNSAKSSIYVSMYTISRPEFNSTLINLKKANPSLDIKVLISQRRVGASENIDTYYAAKSLVDNLIPVYNSTTDDDKVDGYYHNKYWIIDGKYVFVYTGNWSPRSVTPKKTSYSSGEANRDMGIVIKSTEIADYFKSVFDQDVAVATAWELPVSIKQTSLVTGQVINEEVTINGVISGLENPNISYRVDTGEFIPIETSGTTFSIKIDTKKFDNGIHNIELLAKTDSLEVSDKVTINIVNLPEGINWRVLITEVYPNPDPEPDSEGEFVEITNSFPFSVLLEGWKFGDDKETFAFSSDFKIAQYSSIIIARNATAFESLYGIKPELELDFALTNTKDYVQLIDPLGNVADLVAYGMNAPDGSQSLDPPEKGMSLQRSPLYIDTNQASDFVEASPDPKGEVPKIPLTSGIVNDTKTTNFDTSLLVVLILTLILHRKRRNR